MRKFLLALAAAGGMVVSFSSAAGAMPLNTPTILDALREDPLLHQARIVCVNRYSGRILHYGPCRRRVKYRVYCRNRYTGRFLYWGRCRY